MALAVTVELYISGGWVDVTAYARVVDGGISISRGTPNEGGTADVSRCTLSLDNTDGRFSPRNPSSPYYGLIGRNTRCRVSVGASVRFVGEIASWPPKWNVPGTSVWVPVEAAGVMRRLNAGGGPALHSSLRRYLTSRMNANDSITAYWPAEDEDGAAAIANARRAAQPLRYLVAPALAAWSGIPATSPVPTWAGAGAVTRSISPPGTGTDFAVGFLLGVPPGGTADEATLLSWSTGNGTIGTWSVKYDLGGGGALRVQAFDIAGVEVLNSNTGFALDGDEAYVLVSAAKSGANVAWQISVIELVDGVASTSSTTSSIATQTVGTVTSLSVGPGLAITGALAIGHIITSAAIIDLDLTDLAAALEAHAGEQADDRILRLATEEGVDAQVLIGNVAAERMGPQLPLSLMALLRECEAADRGTLHERRDDLGLRYVSRAGFYSDVNAAVNLDYTGGDLSPPLEPTDDDATTQNDVTVTRPGGSSGRAVRETGPLSVQPPPLGVGRYAVSTPVNVYTDDQLPDLAAWSMAVGTVDEARYPAIHLDLAEPAHAAKVASWAGRDISDWVTLTNLPGWLPPDDVDLVILGYTEVIRSHGWDIVLNCVPAVPYRVAELNSAEYGRLDSENTTTAEALDTTETDVDYTVAAGGALWVTTAVNPAEFPFDIVIGGEVMTVTAATGTTFTVTRSVNGIVKSHLTGQPVRLARPVVIAL